MKFGKKNLNIVLIALLALGLAGCASNDSASSKNNTKTTSAKTTHAKKASDKQSQSSSVASSSSTNQSSDSSDGDSSDLTVDMQHILVYKDDQGRIHHVDWDLNDIISVPGQKETHAEYAQTPFPKNAKKYAYSDFHFNTDNTHSDEWILQFDKATHQY
ncbi:MAG: hypothetical protein Q3959_00375 [Limosilactobacillus sp.]|uniref:hypothetical protein n=1 Tax=Limosilactobacillus sp. TaxID=2773925 RepID=UPI00270471B4|nr:hypothetical protein [Limosilactobacillus sp.]